MTLNVGVKALFGWVNSLKVADRELAIGDFRDGSIILKVVHILKKELNQKRAQPSIDDPSKLIADFLKNDCRFTGAPLSWHNIPDDANLTIEIAKVLLLLVYYDMMNDRCTLNMLESDMEREIAYLTSRFVMESEGCVYLNNALDAYLTRRYLPICHETLDRSASTSSSSASTGSLLSDHDESPFFHRTQKIAFVQMQTVASSSVSKSPLQDIMNTPKFQLRKMKRQMIKEQDYRDHLERELASHVTLIAQRESQINKLQYHLDKMKEEQGNQEQVTREQINELETKNITLHLRLDEILKRNKDLKDTSSIMERKVDELTDENGVLSSQVRAVYSQLASFEAEVSRLTESQASAQEEWTSTTSRLQLELHQATAEKELLAEQVQILQGKISCLEDEIRRITKEEVGENMGPIMEREMFEKKINNLRNELESTFSSLQKAEMEVEAKSQKVAHYQQEVVHQKELLEQQKSKAEEIIQAKDEILDKMEKEITEQRAHLQQEIKDLELQLEKVEQQKTEQMIRLQQHVAACEQEIQKLKELKREKEALLNQTEEKVKDLEKRLCAAGSLLADKDQQINSLKEEVDSLAEETKRNKEKIQAKEEMLASLNLEKLNEQQLFHNKIQTLAVQVDELGSSLKQAKQQILIEQDLLAKTQQDKIQQTESLQQKIASCEDEVQFLQSQIQTKNEQLVKLQVETALQSEIMEQEINYLKSNLESLNDSLIKATEHVQAQQIMLDKQQQDSAHQKELLQQQLSASEEAGKRMREEIQVKEAEVTRLKDQSLQEAELLNKEIQDLKKQVECLSSSLKSVEENLQTKEHVFVEQQMQNSQQMEVLQVQMAASHHEVKKLNAEIDAKEEQLVKMKTETSAHSEQLWEEIEHLTKQIQNTSSSLQIAEDQVQAKDDLLAKQEQDHTSQIEALKEHSAALEEKIHQLKMEVQTKESAVAEIKVESSKESELLQNEIQALKDQVRSLSESLKSATEQVQAKEEQLAQKELELSQEKETFKFKMSASEEEMEELKEEIQIKEEQLVSLRHDSCVQSDQLRQEISALTKELDETSCSLTKAEETIQVHVVTLKKQQQGSAHQKELLQQQLSASEEAGKRMREEIQAKEAEVTRLKDQSLQEAELLNKEIQDLKKQVECLSSSLKSAEENLQTKEHVFVEQQMQNSQQMEVLQVQMAASHHEVKKLNAEIDAKEEQLVKMKTETSAHSEQLREEIEHLTKQIQNTSSSLQIAKDQVQAKDDLLAKQEQDHTSQIEALKEHSAALEEKIHQLKMEVQTKESAVAEIKVESSKESELLQNEIQALKDQVRSLSESLKLATEQVQAKEEQLAQKELELSQEKETFKFKMSASEEEMEELKEEIQTKEEQLVSLRHDSCVQSDQLRQEISALTKELDETSCSLTKAEETIQVHVVTLNKQQQDSAHQKELLQQQLSASEEAGKRMREEIQAKEAEVTRLKGQSLQEAELLNKEIQAKENQLSLQLCAKEQMLLETKQECAQQVSVLQQQLCSVNAELNQVKEHYKAQMEKAVNHYNIKKKLLQKSEEEMANLRHLVDVKEGELKTTAVENKQLQLDLDKVQTSEKKLLQTVASLEAQLAYADRSLRAQNKIHGSEGRAANLCYLNVPAASLSTDTRAEVKGRALSSDSLDGSSLEDSLNSTRKLGPEGSSTPLVRSSERLAKRRALEAGSLETLYFTPINLKPVSRADAQHGINVDSSRKNPTSSVKRRRTTQKTPDCGEEDETFYSLASARSQPNLSRAQSAQPLSMELFNTPATRTGAASDQLSGLPGLRRSTVLSQTTSTFSVRAENEPESGPDDWMRIAELQARNKACLPHLKSSYPVECETGRGGAFVLTDEELRTGDPSDTIRRMSMMPSQLQDSLVSHRQSLMAGPIGAAANTQSHRLSLMPGQQTSKALGAAQLRSPNGTKRTSSTLSLPQTSPEKKVKGSCFPRPLTPKNKNVIPVLSPADRRQSMVFNIDNTPKNNTFLKKGLSKLRSSRKSPGKKKSPTQKNIPSRHGVGKAASAVNIKSPKTTSRPAKSPGLTSSARKMMRRINV